MDAPPYSYGGDKGTFYQDPHPGCPGREDLGFNPRGSGRQQTSYSETIRKRNNNHRLSDIQLPREAGTPHQVWRVPEPIGIWSSFSDQLNEDWVNLENKSCVEGHGVGKDQIQVSCLYHRLS